MALSEFYDRLRQASDAFFGPKRGIVGPEVLQVSQEIVIVGSDAEGSPCHYSMTMELPPGCMRITIGGQDEHALIHIATFHETLAWERLALMDQRAIEKARDNRERPVTADLSPGILALVPIPTAALLANRSLYLEGRQIPVNYSHASFLTWQTRRVGEIINTIAHVMR